ncbi:MAG: DinB family protein [Deinococcales bacterium]
MTTIAVLFEQMNRAAKAYQKALETYPEDKFHQAVPAGGHSAAWHALHIADWVQILVPNKLESVSADLRFGYLGWENSEFAQGVYGLGEVNHNSSKAEIVQHLKTQLGRAAQDVQNASEAQLEANVSTPMGERKILSILLTHIAHVPYHYGQVQLSLKQQL